MSAPGPAPAGNDHRPARSAAHALGAKASFGFYRFASAAARALPGPVVEAVPGLAGLVMPAVLRGRLTMLERHLRRVHGPGLDDAGLRREVRRALASYTRYWGESFRLPGTTPARLAEGMTSEGLEHVERGLTAGNGVILALPHLGGWDYGGAWLASLGYPMVAVVEAVEPPELFRWFVDLRRSLGLDVVALGPSAGSTTLRRLKENAVVALVCDRDIGGAGVEVEFFGEGTTLPGGPAMLALRSGAPLLPSAVYFGERGSHLAVIGEALDTARRGRLRDDVARVTQDLARHLEVLIRRAPDQWHLLQPNWPSDRAATPAH